MNPFWDIARSVEQDDTMGIRVFDSLDVEENWPTANWGMEFEQPEWLKDVHNKYVGERCFLMGTGPSLIEQLPLLEQMKTEYTFSCNRMKMFQGLPFTPWLHCISEPGPLMAWGAAVHPTYDYPEAQNRVACIWFPVKAPGWLWMPKAPDDLQVRWQGTFGMGDYLPPVPSAWASPLTISQLALWMGFTELYLLGNDLSQTGQAWDKETGTTKFPRNVRSTVECADRMNRDIWRNGRKMYDCTPGGRLSVEGAVEYIDLEEVLEGTKQKTEA